MCGEFGFFRAKAAKKQFLQSGFRPEIRENFRNPQFSSHSTKLIAVALAEGRSATSGTLASAAGTFAKQKYPVRYEILEKASKYFLTRKGKLSK